jgi:hypothetical protein
MILCMIDELMKIIYHKASDQGHWSSHKTDLLDHQYDDLTVSNRKKRVSNQAVAITANS